MGEEFLGEINPNSKTTWKDSHAPRRPLPHRQQEPNFYGQVLQNQVFLLQDTNRNPS